MEPLLDIREVAEILSVTDRTVERLVREDSTFPPPARVGRSRRWRREWIEDYIDANRERPAITQVASIVPPHVNLTNPHRKTGYS